MCSLRVHHIGYLVKKIDAAADRFERLGYRACTDACMDTVYDEFRKVHIRFLEKDGYVIELVSPADPTSVVAGLLKKYKNCPYHICYESQDLEADLAVLAKEGYTAIDTPTPAPALDGRRVVFLMSPVLGMIELLEAGSAHAL